MTPTLRTAILDALMERWRDAATPEWMETDDVATLSCEQSLTYLTLQEPIQREYFASCLDMILPVAEPIYREAALREAAGVAQAFAATASLELKAVQANWFAHGEVTAATAIKLSILALGEPK